MGPQCPLLTDDPVPSATANAEPASSPAPLQIPSLVPCMSPQFLKPEGKALTWVSLHPGWHFRKEWGAIEEGKHKVSRCLSAPLFAVGS